MDIALVHSAISVIFCLSIWPYVKHFNTYTDLPRMDTLLRNSSYIFLFLSVLPCEKKKGETFSFVIFALLTANKKPCTSGSNSRF